MMNKTKALICVIIPVLLAYALNTKFGDTPPLLKFLNPFTGFWQNAEPVNAGFDGELKLPMLKDKVDVYMDDRLVPHVYAANDLDACGNALFRIA